MKKIAFILIALVSFLIARPALLKATEYPLNPDRFPSIGLSYQGYGSEGEHKIPSTGFQQDVEEATGLLILDTRLPLSNSLTLDLALGTFGTQSEVKASGAIPQSETVSGGGYIRLGVRYYFNKSARQRGTDGL